MNIHSIFKIGHLKIHEWILSPFKAKKNSQNTQLFNEAAVSQGLLNANSPNNMRNHTFLLSAFFPNESNMFVIRMALWYLAIPLSYENGFALMQRFRCYLLISWPHRSIVRITYGSLRGTRDKKGTTIFSQLIFHQSHSTWT